MPIHFPRIGIIGKFADPGIASTLEEIVHFLQGRGHQVLVDNQINGLINNLAVKNLPLDQLSEHCDLLITVGGDGTFLTGARSAAKFDIPIIGVNLGRLGFLVDISPEQLASRLCKILDGAYKTEQRCLLQAEIIRDNVVIQRENAANEVVVHRWVTPSMIEIVTTINGAYLNTQRSDGLIVATPTGSTAYSLSAGGPILHPALHALVLVPLNPHTLSNRPIVIDDSAEIEISFSPTKQINALVTCDHLEIPDVLIGDKIKIKKTEKTIKILHPEDHDYFNILRSKLNWSRG